MTKTTKKKLGLLMLLLPATVYAADHVLVDAAVLTKEQFGVIGVMLMLSIALNIYLFRLIKEKDKQLMEAHGDFHTLSQRFLLMLSRLSQRIERPGSHAVELDEFVDGNSGGR